LQCHPNLPRGDLPFLRNGHRLLHAGVLDTRRPPPAASGREHLRPPNRRCSPPSGFSTVVSRPNPCTGAGATLTLTFKGVLHITPLDNGTVHVTMMDVGTLTAVPDDPQQ